MTNIDYKQLIADLADDEVKNTRVQEMIRNHREDIAIDVLLYRMGDRITYDVEEGGKFAPLTDLLGPSLRSLMRDAAGRRVMNP